MKSEFGEAWDRLFGPPVAHRGFWSKDGAPENSLAAFHAACEHGYSIELDVQLSADGEAMVFHDNRLDRMTASEGRVADHTAADLRTIKLAGSDETIPTLTEALAEVGRRAMVFIEIKTPLGEVGPLERRVHEILIDHAGPISIINFNPYSHAWFADHHPKILRGLNSWSYSGPESRQLSPDVRKAYAKLAHVPQAKPHFLNLGIDMLPSAKADEYRANGMPVLAWTIRDAAKWDALRSHCDNLVFEGFAA